MSGTISVVGGGPAGMTAALLLARAKRDVTLYEAGPELGGLWASRRDDEGFFRGDNSCKVFQSSYRTAPALFERIGTRWQDHFVPRFDLSSDWLRPFVRDCTARDLAVLTAAFLRWRIGRGASHEVSVEDFLEARGISDGCRAWMRATALGGIAGTLRMTMWEFFHRLGANVSEVFGGAKGPLFWNAQSPSGSGGFVSIWQAALEEAGVRIEVGAPVDGIVAGESLALELNGGSTPAAAVFLAVPPPALGSILGASPKELGRGLGVPGPAYFERSRYEHLGITWFFDRPLPHGLPLGGNNVRAGWHPILVEHPQYGPQLRPPAVTCVVSSVALDTVFRHQRLGTLASEHSPEEIARILWEDEQAVDPSLPDPIDVEVMGNSSATQIVAHGPLELRHPRWPVYVATNMHGRAPYFTASLESAIQAGAVAAQAFDPSVDPLPMGRPVRLPWRRGRPVPHSPVPSCAPSS